MGKSLMKFDGNLIFDIELLFHICCAVYCSHIPVCGANHTEVSLCTLDQIQSLNAGDSWIGHQSHHSSLSTGKLLACSVTSVVHVRFLFLKCNMPGCRAVPTSALVVPDLGSLLATTLGGQSTGNAGLLGGLGGEPHSLFSLGTQHITSDILHVMA